MNLVFASLTTVVIKNVQKNFLTRSIVSILQFSIFLTNRICGFAVLSIADVLPAKFTVKNNSEIFFFIALTFEIKIYLCLNIFDILPNVIKQKILYKCLNAFKEVDFSLFCDKIIII